MQCGNAEMFWTYISFIISLLQIAIQILISTKFTGLITVYAGFLKVDLNNYKIQKTVSEFKENVT